MKKIILSLVLLLTLVSCEVYDQPKTLSLSGEYIIDRITRTSTENTSGTQQLVVYQPGDTFISNTESFPMDMIGDGEYDLPNGTVDVDDELEMCEEDDFELNLDDLMDLGDEENEIEEEEQEEIINKINESLDMFKRLKNYN